MEEMGKFEKNERLSPAEELFKMRRFLIDEGPYRLIKEGHEIKNDLSYCEETLKDYLGSLDLSWMTEADINLIGKPADKWKEIMEKREKEGGHGEQPKMMKKQIDDFLRDPYYTINLLEKLKQLRNTDLGK